MTITNTTKYNGWTNYETWACNLWFCSFDFTDLMYIFDGCEDKGDILNTIEDYIKDYVEEFVEDATPSNTHGFIQDMINSAIQEIDFRDIAEHYVDFVADELIKAEQQSELSSEDESGPFFVNFADNKESLAAV
tara:strand:- start:1357 stop:1758 length:402 start_codon:yes stop_codon:yes gene_type:complete